MRYFEANAITFQVRLSCHFRMKCVLMLKFMLVLEHCDTDVYLKTVTQMRILTCVS